MAEIPAYVAGIGDDHFEQFGRGGYPRQFAHCRLQETHVFATMTKLSPERALARIDRYFPAAKAHVDWWPRPRVLGLPMNRFAILAAILSETMILSGAAQALEIRQFDKMADQDQAAYIGDLIVGAENVLTKVGHEALAAQVRRLFTTKAPGDADTMGMVEFERLLALVRSHDAKHPEEQPSEVEDVMVLTLKGNHIELPDSFYDVNKNFRPKLPPKK